LFCHVWKPRFVMARVCLRHCLSTMLDPLPGIMIDKELWPPPKQLCNILRSEPIQLCFSLWSPCSSNWVIVQQRPPWPPPTLLVMQDDEVQSMPIPWPSFHGSTAIVHLQTSMSILITDSVNMCLMRSCNCEFSKIFRVHMVEPVIQWSNSAYESALTNLHVTRIRRTNNCCYWNQCSQFSKEIFIKKYVWGGNSNGRADATVSSRCKCKFAVLAEPAFVLLLALFDVLIPGHLRLVNWNGLDHAVVLYDGTQIHSVSVLVAWFDAGQIRSDIHIYKLMIIFCWRYKCGLATAEITVQRDIMLWLDFLVRKQQQQFRILLSDHGFLSSDYTPTNPVKLDSGGWATVQHMLPWPPYVQCELQTDGVHIRPIPWPSFSTQSVLRFENSMKIW